MVRPAGAGVVFMDPQFPKGRMPANADPLHLSLGGQAQLGQGGIAEHAAARLENITRRRGISAIRVSWAGGGGAHDTTPSSAGADLADPAG